MLKILDMFKKSLLLILLLICFFAKSIDTLKVDNLINKIRVANNETKAKLFLELANEIYDDRLKCKNYSDSAKHYSLINKDSITFRLALFLKAKVEEDEGHKERALPVYFSLIEDFRRLEEHQNLIDVYTALAKHYHNHMDSKKAIKYISLAEQIIDLNKSNKLKSGKLIKIKGDVYKHIGLYEAALKNYLQSIELLKNEKELITLNRVYTEIGGIEMSIENYDQAKYYFNLSEQLANQLNSIDQLAYLQMYKHYFHLNRNNLEKALSLIDSVVYYRGLMNKDTIVYPWKNFQKGECYELLKKYDLAEIQFKIALQKYKYGRRFYFDKTNPMQFKHFANSYLNIARIKFHKNELDSSLILLDSAERYTKIFPEYSSSEIYKWKSKIYEVQNKYDSSMIFLKRHIHLKDSIREAKKQEQLEFLDAQFQNKLLLSEVNLLEEKNKVSDLIINRGRLYIGIGVVIFLALIVIVLLNGKIKRDKVYHSALELKHKLLHTQMNPHFLFNTLSSIQSLLLKEDKRNAAKYLSKFSKLIRDTLESSREDLILLSVEIRLVSNYLSMQKLRLKDKFEFTIKVDENIEIDQWLVPPFFIQPIIENSIQHGIKHINGIGEVKLDINETSKDIIISIVDNGIGLKKSKEINNKLHSEHKSYSTVINQERLKTIEKKYGLKITFETIELNEVSKNIHGSKTIFTIPKTTI